MTGTEQWRRLLRTWGVDSIKADEKFDEIAAAHSESGRFYHSLDHVMAVLATVESLALYAKNLNVVKLAAWLHDVIYDSKASDNEERSAEYAERLCEDLAIPDGNLVAALIRKTKTHDPGEDADAQVLLDADLAILGADETEYQAYAENIRREYAWVPEPEYRKGRQQVLQTFLTKPRIYHFLNHLEQLARRNLAGEIASLADRRNNGHSTKKAYVAAGHLRHLQARCKCRRPCLGDGRQFLLDQQPKRLDTYYDPSTKTSYKCLEWPDKTIWVDPIALDRLQQSAKGKRKAFVVVPPEILVPPLSDLTHIGAICTC